jgi:hypothetical protein
MPKPEESLMCLVALITENSQEHPYAASIIVTD